MHSLTMCSDSDFEKWKSGELIYDWRYGELITQEKYKQRISEEMNDKSKPVEERDVFAQLRLALLSKEAGGQSHIYYTYDDFVNEVDVFDTTFHQTFTTDSGEVVHSFGYHGRT